MPLSTRSLTRLTASALFLLAVPTARADAQAACAAGPLASYLAPDFACRLGGWVLSDFSSTRDAEAVNGAESLTVDPLATLVSPFVEVPRAGRRLFGFDLENFFVAAGSHGTTSGFERSAASATFGFHATRAAGGHRLIESRINGGFDGFNTTRGLLFAASTIGGTVEELSGPGVCLGDSISSTEFGGTAAEVLGPCDRPVGGAVVVDVFAASLAERNQDGTDSVDGFSAASLARVELTQAVVPEPATVMLVASGLFAVAGVGHMRARARSAAVD